MTAADELLRALLRPCQGTSTDKASLALQVIDFSPITSMYGAVHCSSQVRSTHIGVSLAWQHNPLFQLIMAAVLLHIA
jgi:hypothetical protein